MSSLTIERVRSRAQLVEFALLPTRLHPRSLVVPTPMPVLRSWWRGPRARQNRVELLLARDTAGRVVGRTTVHSDVRLDARLGSRTLLFGATEFADGEVAAALFAAIEERARGHEQLIGPVSLLPVEGGGVVTSGFAQRGFVGSVWNPATYPAAYEQYGFEPIWPGDTWSVQTRPRSVGDPRGPVSPAEWESVGLRPRRLPLSRVDSFRAEMLGVINRAGAVAPFATERTAGEFDSAGTSWLALVDPDLLRLAVDPSTGSIGAFALALPDYTRFLQATRGRVSLLDGARAVLSRMRFRQEAILVLQCTDPSQQRRGVGALIGRDLQAHLARRGYRRLRVPYVARDSTAARSQLERFGGVPLHGITFYRRALR